MYSVRLCRVSAWLVMIYSVCVSVDAEFITEKRGQGIQVFFILKTELKYLQSVRPTNVQSRIPELHSLCYRFIGFFASAISMDFSVLRCIQYILRCHSFSNFFFNCVTLTKLTSE